MIHVEQKEEFPVEFCIDKFTEWEHVQTLVLMLFERRLLASQADMQMVTPQPWEARELMTSHYHSKQQQGVPTAALTISKPA